MRYGQIREFDIANGPGIRSSIFVTGCSRNCKNCFNKEYQDFNFGSVWGEEETKQILKYLNNTVNNGLTILGGEPFENTEGLLSIVREIKNNSNKSIWIYSGYTFEYLIQNEENKKLLHLCDVLVDGPFVEELKDLTLQFRGSSNQRIIDLVQTRLEKQIVLWTDRKE
ncbi:MAG: anaerobic ribonucleoside-triphosphate reductase activating protein [Gallicola sp.]|nr:anaerobic ribonucleoside-triphosphate reductase activating protein [Gallicola sp.]